MRWRQLVLALALVTAAVALEFALFSRLRLPGATPDLVAVAVGLSAAVFGPGVGAVTGFVGGFLLDIAPPADGIVGLWAAGFTVVGYVIGARESLQIRGRLVLLAEIAAGGVVALLVRLVVGGVLGDPRVAWTTLPTLVVTEFLYTFVLAALLLPVAARVGKRLGAQTDTRPA